jgi:hypothetical protein
MVESALRHIRFFEDNDFGLIKVSLKSSDVITTTPNASKGNSGTAPVEVVLEVLLDVGGGLRVVLDVLLVVVVEGPARTMTAPFMKV